MTNVYFEGAAVAITTPFQDDVIDYEMYERHIEWLIENDIQALFVNGTTGEASTLSEDEKLKLVEIAVKTANKRIPIIVGTGTNNTQASIEHSLKVKALGADGIMLITPYYNKTNQRGLIQHFETIANAVQLPVVLYNVPARTNMTIEPETVLILSKNPYIYALKDATNDIEYTKKVKALVNEDFKLYSGNDDSMISFFEYGSGVISVVANAIPSEIQNIYELYQENPEQSKHAFDQVVPIIQSLDVDINPIPIKALMTHLGYAHGTVRLPLVPLLNDQVNTLIETYEMNKNRVSVI
ncbi:4-hydroxy-tetrahydrodipicolinate synthase [Macrococcus sp. DPC7161]|uniref:4-hydroxy-tetrahydrodipicolinate synthase n=1 Tax=Macrococcus sp. DPC7161 TaxID=2507060 RepID=UPI00100AA653|nr:4-hydroxy-tetrahydrodipicolinate synthase [Macrococcus sp. DPC7161]RXK19207.1 4-hydroxy-tetrahydrodipicolinate synthase [Macrococcus sp. DPC7161]